MKDNFFNTNIIQNHDLNIWLNNSMAETYDFCLSVAVALGNETDQEWYYQQKKGYICYDI